MRIQRGCFSTVLPLALGLGCLVRPLGCGRGLLNAICLWLGKEGFAMNLGMLSDLSVRRCEIENVFA